MKVHVLFMPVYCSAVWALAENSELVTRMFNLKKYNGHYYKVYLTRQTIGEEMIVDNYFPHLPMDQTYFTDIKFTQVWPIVLEKAYAKHRGCYENIVITPLQNVLLDLTGYPVEIFEMKIRGMHYIFTDSH
jgi:Calpain family cysteine protease